MAEIIITEAIGRDAILGGAILGGGGGGSMAGGLEKIKEANRLGDIRLIDIDDVDPETILLTCSAVGAPAAKKARALPADFVRVVEILTANGCGTIAGFIPNECGGGSITNGWLPAAMMRLPVVDALCNGRAHPTGLMGAMGLHKHPDYISRQAAAGGNREEGLYLEMHASGNIKNVSYMVRTAADQAGGLVAVARNPVKASYVKQYGACGALKQAISLGRAVREASGEGGEKATEAAAAHLGGEIIAFGEVTRADIVTQGGFDTGIVTIDGFETSFWNEYMTLEKNGVRLATFPDLITTLDVNGTPVSTAEIRVGQKVYLLRVPAAKLILGEGMRSIELMESIEPVIGKDIVKYLNF